MAASSPIDGTAPERVGTDPLGEQVYLLLVLALVVGVAWRPIAGNPDYGQYRDWYEQGTSLGEYLRSPWLILERDPGYFAVTSLLRHVGVPFAAFAALFSGLWAAVKGIQIFRLSNAPFVSLFFYACFFYPLQEWVQMRAGAATALFLVALPLLVEGRRLAYVAIILAASTLQLSALIVLPLVFLGNEGVRPRWYLGALLASAAFAASGIRLDFVVYFLADLALDPRIAEHAADIATNMPTGTAFNRVSLPELLLAVVLLLEFEKVRTITPYASHVVRIFAYAQILFFVFVTGVPVFGFRLTQLVGIVGVLAWALLWALLHGDRLKLAVMGMAGILYLTASARLFP